MSLDVSGDFDTGKVYLNNASVSLMPTQSIEVMREFLVEYNSLGPDSQKSESFVAEKLKGARDAISRIISCQPDEVVLTQSTTDGINIVANGMEFPENSNIVIRGMEHEHHANFYPWLKLGERIHLRSLPIDHNGLFATDDLKSAIDGNTKLVALSHALYNTGAILPVEEIGRILGRTPYFVDAAQSIGCINVDVSKMGCDYMSFNGSKWLCGPMGTGIFYCSRASSAMLESRTIGGESAMLYEGTKLAFKDLPDRFQTGFRNYAGVVGLESSARYVLRLGIDNIRDKNRRLSAILRDELARIPKITLYGPDDAQKRTSIVSFNVEGVEPQHVVDRLEREGIVLAVREIGKQKLIRASPHFFNTESEMVRTASEIKKL